MKLAELLQKIVAEREISCNKLCSFYWQWKQHRCSFQSKQRNDDIAESDNDESDTDSVAPEESEELFSDLEENELQVENW